MGDGKVSDVAPAPEPPAAPRPLVEDIIVAELLYAADDAEGASPVAAQTIRQAAAWLQRYWENPRETNAPEIAVERRRKGSLV